MDANQFLDVARDLAAATTEAAWRSALSRMYYAAFHVARQLLMDLGFFVPRADRAHSFIHFRLANCGDPKVQWAGTCLNNLRLRNEADYDLGKRFTQAEALSFLPLTREIIEALDKARTEPTRSAITEARKIYERDVLREVTWRA